ncbi:multidrug ABC transporter permease/ATP-binding protein [Campylobacter concisus]|uniref:multidrug ABC transporter permease/ATP-binding protein n=3 Tax=Campylobacter concisus TaxID=199 RepID=UPI000D3461CD|nr:multidrug ABC transporter permease/ATP-binding protein [Campylobacter concisus]QPH87361.1 multidrug ABC transporter permease/ATP-binding protein [Campylobacter concisus]QPI02309.1 multidrug ABC transporter permease/ATP-binding protein [Campylobacter concisus]
MLANLIKKNIYQISKIVLLTLVFSGLGVWTLSFINNELVNLKEFDTFIAVKFIVVLLLFFVSAIAANISLTNFGHKFIYELRYQSIKQILDTPNSVINEIGKAKIIASLNNDIKTITFAFMSATGFIQSLVFIVCASIYLCVIAPKIFIFLSIWIGATLFINTLFMKKIHLYFKHSRVQDDALQKHYDDIVEGHRELSLNRARASVCFDELNFTGDKKRQNMVKADIYHALSDNFTNIMLLGSVGLCVFLCVAFDWASLQTALSISLTILFLRGSFMSMVGSIPAALSAKVSLEKIMSLNLNKFKESFKFDDSLNGEWKNIKLKDINFNYTHGKFSLKDVNLEIKRGEITFIIGKNGSGKSTLINLLCGLMRPSSGEIYLDSTKIDEANLQSYQAKISAIFADFYLFSQTLSHNGFASQSEIDELLALLEIDKKVSVIDNKLSTTQLSTGQRKRLSLLIAILEHRSILILDEWAADQDPLFKRKFYKEILPFLQSKGISIIAVSHDDSYFDVATRIILVKDGFVRELDESERISAAKDAVEKIK